MKLKNRKSRIEYFTGGNPMKGMLFNILNQDIDYIDMYEWH